MKHWSRRSWLQVAGLGSFAGGAALLSGRSAANQDGALSRQRLTHGSDAMGPVGRVSPDSFSPAAFIRTWNFSNLPPTERSRFYRETPRPDGSLLREYEFFSVDREIEIAPGCSSPRGPTTARFPAPRFGPLKGTGFG